MGPHKRKARGASPSMSPGVSSLPTHRGSREAPGPALRPESRVPGPGCRLRSRSSVSHAGGSPRGAPGIPGRPAAVVQRVLTPSPGDGRGRARRLARGRPAARSPGGRSGHGRRRPPAYIPRLNLGCTRSSSPSGTRFRRRRLGPAPARAAPIRPGRARPRPAEPSPPRPARLRAAAPWCPEPASAPAPGHGAERAHPAVFLHFRQPVPRARPAGGEGGRDSEGGRLRAADHGLRGSRTQAAGAAGSQ